MTRPTLAQTSGRWHTAAGTGSRAATYYQPRCYHCGRQLAEDPPRDPVRDACAQCEDRRDPAIERLLQGLR